MNKLEQVRTDLTLVNKRIALLEGKKEENCDTIKNTMDKVTGAVISHGYKEESLIKDLQPARILWIYGIKKGMLASLPKSERSAFDYFANQMSAHQLKRSRIRADVSAMEKYFKAVQDTDAIKEENKELSLAIDELKAIREKLSAKHGILKHAGELANIKV